MLCEVIEEVVTRRGTFRPGEKIDIPDAVVQKLAGKVRPADTPPTAAELFELLGKTLALIDRAGRPWDGWRKSLTETQRQALRAVEQRIDVFVLSLDRAGLIAALAEYRQLTTREKNQI